MPGCDFTSFVRLFPPERQQQDLARQFLGNLNRVEQIAEGGFSRAVEAKKAANGAVAPPPITPAPPAQGLPYVEVSVPAPMAVGSLLSYLGATAVPADCREDHVANMVVIWSSGTLVRARPLCSLEEMDLLVTGTGDDGSGKLWTFINGGVTRNSAQIRNPATGKFVDGAKFRQQCGSFAGKSPHVAGSGKLRGVFYAYPDTR